MLRQRCFTNQNNKKEQNGKEIKEDKKMHSFCNFNLKNNCGGLTTASRVEERSVLY